METSTEKKKCPCKSKTVWLSAGLIAYGVWMVAHGNTDTGMTAIGTGLTAIFARTSNSKLTFKK